MNEEEYEYDGRPPITEEQLASYSAAQKRFVEDMEEAGFEPYHYRGRFYYEGPAVDTEEGDREFDLQAAIRATDVKVQWDNMAMDYVVYPK